jgi:hypothetical protein
MHTTVTLPRLAKTLQAIMDGVDPVANIIRNRASPLLPVFVEKVMSLLLIGYPGRRPRKQTDRRGNPRPTDMDLASFLVMLMKKPTIIELPAYTAALPRAVFASERHLGHRRHGHLLGLSSHRELLSFGVTIQDMNIVKRSPLEEDTLGSPRTFLIMGHDAGWHTGWQGVSWQFRQDELGFRERYDLIHDASHRDYQYFVHPNRRHSIFSRAHLLLKLLWQRIEDERRHYHHHQIQNTTGEAVVESCSSFRNIMVPSFTMSLTGLPSHGDYPVYEGQEGISALTSYLEHLSHLQKQVQFLVRANELAFFQYGRTNNYVANWVRGGVWDYQPGADAYRQTAVLRLTAKVALTYTADVVAKKVAD